MPGGLVQWRDAVERAKRPTEWTVHTPLAVADTFDGSTVTVDVQPSLNLDTELRFHFAKDLHRYVADLVSAAPASGLKPRADQLETSGFHLRLTRNLNVAKEYLRERYKEDRDARFGLLASSKDKDLERFGIPNGFQDTKRVKLGPWYGDPEDAYSGLSCRLLKACVTEFGAQGLELDATLLAWGTDFVMTGGRWSNANARRYQLQGMVRDAMQLRRNAYRVLLTRGRDVCVVFVPPLPQLDETHSYLRDAGWLSLD